jgi:hypothetical protein
LKTRTTEAVQMRALALRPAGASCAAVAASATHGAT